MGSIRRRPDKRGRYQVVIELGTDPATGKRLTRTALVATEKDATRLRARMQVEADSGRLGKRRGETVADICATWLEAHAQHKSPHTYEDYQRTVRLHIIPHLGVIKASELKPPRVRNWITTLLNTGKGHRTVALAHLNLRQALEMALDDGIIMLNPAAKVRVPQPADRGREMHTWTEDEARQFLEAADRHSTYGPLWVVSLATGMRRGELLGLRWRDVQWKTNELQVRQQVAPGGVIRPYLKNQKSRRDVLVDPAVVDALREHRTWQAAWRLRLGPAWQDHDLVFATEVGTPINPSNLYRLYKKIVADAGVPYIRIHDQRHTHITWALEEKADLKAVSERAGHSSMATTGMIYQHVTRKLRDDVVEKTSAKLFPRTKPS